MSFISLIKKNILYMPFIVIVFSYGATFFPTISPTYSQSYIDNPIPRSPIQNNPFIFSQTGHENNIQPPNFSLPYVFLNQQTNPK